MSSQVTLLTLFLVFTSFYKPAFGNSCDVLVSKCLKSCETEETIVGIKSCSNCCKVVSLSCDKNIKSDNQGKISSEFEKKYDLCLKKKDTKSYMRAMSFYSCCTEYSFFFYKFRVLDSIRAIRVLESSIWTLNLVLEVQKNSVLKIIFCVKIYYLVIEIHM